MPTGPDNIPQAPVCEACGLEMSPLAMLPRMGNTPCVRVYKCVPCGKIQAVYEN